MPGLIDIGSQRQRCLDDWLLESARGVERVFASPDKLGQVLSPDRPWEGNAQTIRCALHDEHDGLYKLWYTTATVVSRPGTPAGAFEIDYGGPSHTCLATSTDGLSWDKPELGIVDYEGSRANNILEPPLAGSAASVKGWFIDPREADPARRYTTLARSAEADPEVVRQRQADPDVYYEMDPEHAETLREKGNWSCLRWDLFHSGDGLRWTPFVGNPVRLDPPQART